MVSVTNWLTVPREVRRLYCNTNRLAGHRCYNSNSQTPVGHTEPTHLPASTAVSHQHAAHTHLSHGSLSRRKRTKLHISGYLKLIISTVYTVFSNRKTGTGLYRSFAALASFSGTFVLILFEAVNFEFIVEKVWFCLVWKNGQNKLFLVCFA